jgi:hypothetical protein
MEHGVFGTGCRRLNLKLKTNYGWAFGGERFWDWIQKPNPKKYIKVNTCIS